MDLPALQKEYGLAPYNGVRSGCVYEDDSYPGYCSRTRHTPDHVGPGVWEIIVKVFP